MNEVQWMWLYLQYHPQQYPLIHAELFHNLCQSWSKYLGGFLQQHKSNSCNSFETSFTDPMLLRKLVLPNSRRSIKSKQWELIINQVGKWNLRLSTRWLSVICMIPVDVWQVRSSYPSPLASNTCKSPPIQGQNSLNSVLNSSPKYSFCVRWSETIFMQRLCKHEPFIDNDWRRNLNQERPMTVSGLNCVDLGMLFAFHAFCVFHFVGQDLKTLFEFAKSDNQVTP